MYFLEIKLSRIRQDTPGLSLLDGKTCILSIYLQPCILLCLIQRPVLFLYEHCCLTYKRVYLKMCRQ